MSDAIESERRRLRTDVETAEDARSMCDDGWSAADEGRGAGRVVAESSEAAAAAAAAAVELVYFRLKGEGRRVDEEVLPNRRLEREHIEVLLPPFSGFFFPLSKKVKEKILFLLLS